MLTKACMFLPTARNPLNPWRFPVLQQNRPFCFSRGSDARAAIRGVSLFGHPVTANISTPPSAADFLEAANRRTLRAPVLRHARIERWPHLRGPRADAGLDRHRKRRRLHRNAQTAQTRRCPAGAAAVDTTRRTRSHFRLTAAQRDPQLATSGFGAGAARRLGGASRKSWRRPKSSAPRRCPRDLRHGFGVNAFQSNVPPHLVQRWLGHASLRTTAIYGDVVGPDERAFAERMWSERTPMRR